MQEHLVKYQQGIGIAEAKAQVVPFVNPDGFALLLAGLRAQSCSLDQKELGGSGSGSGG